MEEFRQRAMRLALNLVLGAVAVTAGGVLLVGAGLEVGWAIGAAGFLLMLAAVWPWTRARGAALVWFGVLERGVIMPASFTNVPGLASLGPPCVLPRSQIQYAKQLRDPAGRAVMVMTGEGMGGVVASRVGPVELSTGEQEKVLDEFTEALRGLGIRFKAETIAQGVSEEPAEPEARG